MNILERLGKFFSDTSVRDYRTWSNGAYHSPQDWERHRQNEIKEFNEHIKEMGEEKARLRANPPQTIRPSAKPYRSFGYFRDKLR